MMRTLSQRRDERETREASPFLATTAEPEAGPSTRLAAALLCGLLLYTRPLYAAPLATEPQDFYRPQFHFTAEHDWINDPNGLVFFDGEYHLFYQCNPQGDTWGHMSWGHAVSRDLTHWQRLPLALAELGNVMAFSGSAVADARNTSGFGKPGMVPLVAVYTGHHTDAPRQDQRLAYSTDLGRTWAPYDGNPVLDIGEKDFRDPKVFWHTPTRRWIMAVSLPARHQISLYSSEDLKRWTHLSDFGPAGSARSLWECPDLFPLPVDGKPGQVKWVLLVNACRGAASGGANCQYFVGAFNGTAFVADPEFAAVAAPDGDGAHWLDFGADFYAVATWSGLPDSRRRVAIGWMNNWRYAERTPTKPFRGALSVPRDLTLRATPAGIRLCMQPAEELSRLRRAPARVFSGSAFDAAAIWLARQEGLPPLLDAEMVFSGVSPASRFRLVLRTGDREETDIAVDTARGTISVDRTRSGLAAFDPAFAATHTAPLRLIAGAIRLRLLLDRCSLELFAQEGETVLTDLIFPTSDVRQFRFEREEGEPPRSVRIALHPLASAP